VFVIAWCLPLFVEEHAGNVKRRVLSWPAIAELFHFLVRKDVPALSHSEDGYRTFFVISFGGLVSE
jgi:hypothetical protein